MSDRDYDDNEYPNDGAFYAVPDALKVEAEDEKAKVLQAKPLIQDVVNHLNARIEFLGTIDSIPADLSIEPADFQKLIEVNRGIRTILANERDYIVAMINRQ